MTREPTTAATYFRPLLKLLAAQGHDVPAVLAACGLDEAQLRQPDLRLPVAKTRALFDRAQALTGDAVLGLTLVRHTEYTTFGGLGLALAAGGSVRSVLERIARFHALVSDVVAMRVVEEGDRLVVCIDERSVPGPHPQSILFLVSTVVGLGRLRLASGLNLQRVVLRELAPEALPLVARFFRCEVVNGPAYRVELAPQLAGAMLEDSDPEMAAMLEQALQARLPREEHPLSLRLSLWLEERFPEGEPSLEEAAAALHLSARSLQRRLGEEGLTWSRLLDNTRRALAERHLHAPGMSLTQLAFLLGFADVSSFSRAFRKWFGVPASRLRRGDGGPAG